MDASIAIKKFKAVMDEAEMIKERIQEYREACSATGDLNAVAECENMMPALNEILEGGYGYAIGFVGETGHGKSTLINRLCGVDLLPTDSKSQGAVTAAITELSSWVSPDRTGYSLTVHFIEAAEWTNYVSDARACPHIDGGQGEEGRGEDIGDGKLVEKMLIAMDGNSKNNLTMMRSRLYDSRVSEMELLKPEMAEAVKGLSKEFVFAGEGALDGLKRKMEEYASTDGRWWPLVRRMHIRGCFPFQGYSVLDIPGYGDGSKFNHATYMKGFRMSDVVYFVSMQTKRMRTDAMFGTIEDIFLMHNKKADRFGVVFTHGGHVKTKTPDELVKGFRAEMAETFPWSGDVPVFLLDNSPRNEWSETFMALYDEYERRFDDFRSQLGRNSVHAAEVSAARATDRLAEYKRIQNGRLADDMDDLSEAGGYLAELLKTIDGSLVQAEVLDVQQLLMDVEAARDSITDHFDERFGDRHWRKLKNFMATARSTSVGQPIDMWPFLVSSVIKKLEVHVAMQSCDVSRRAFLDGVRKLVAGFSGNPPTSASKPFVETICGAIMHRVLSEEAKLFNAVQMWEDVENKVRAVLAPSLTRLRVHEGQGSKRRNLLELRRWACEKVPETKEAIQQVIAESFKKEQERTRASVLAREGYDSVIGAAIQNPIYVRQKLLSFVNGSGEGFGGVGGGTSAPPSSSAATTPSTELTLETLHTIEPGLSPVSVRMLRATTRGAVYVLSNPSFYVEGPLYKIGWTTASVRDRAKQLYKTGVPVAFVQEHTWADVANASIFEKIMHQLFDEFRVNGKREFFDVPRDKIIRVGDEVRKFLDKYYASLG